MKIVNRTYNRDIWGSHGLVGEDSSRPGCDAVSLVEWLPTFRRNVVSSYSRVKGLWPLNMILSTKRNALF
jgi:hypothetical protein